MAAQSPSSRREKQWDKGQELYLKKELERNPMSSIISTRCRDYFKQDKVEESIIKTYLTGRKKTLICSISKNSIKLLIKFPEKTTNRLLYLVHDNLYQDNSLTNPCQH